MSHFAEIDDDGTVLRVIVVANADTADETGAEVESIGQQFCGDLLGGTWVQTSYNHNIRYRYAGAGYTYDSDLDAFITPQPYPSWTLNEDTTDWEAPVPYPDDGTPYDWDEDTTSWVEVTE